MPHDTRPLSLPGFLILITTAVGLMLALVLALDAAARRTGGLELGKGIPMLQHVDRAGTLDIADVAALPATAFTPVAGPLNEGYTHDVYWLQVALPPPGAAPRWLEIRPTYLDRITLYEFDGQAWQARSSGDTIPMAERLRVRQPLFRLAESGGTRYLRIQTSSAMQLHGTVWQEAELLAWLARQEWAAGLYVGICLMLVVFMGASALAFRSRSLGALTALSATTLAHTTALRGYAQLWLPEGLDLWGSDMLSAGTFVLVATLAWQTRELLTRGTAWRRTDRVLAALGLLALAGVASVPLGRYNAWAWTASIIAWLVNILGTGVAAANLRRHGASAERVLVCAPYAVHTVAGTHLAAYFLGLAHARYEAGVLWQIEAFFFYTLITVAAATGLMQKYRASALAQKQLLAELAHSEQVLEERVLQRTSELLQAQNALHAALHSEREMRQEQRHFFDMVNHEFRTPLAVVDSAATEQQAFPGPEIAPQVERATQIRRACRRLMALVDNCLLSDRLDAQAFKPQWRDVPLADIVDAAAELVQWSRRHHLRLDTTQAPACWHCDPTLVRIALSNLVDNAVKHAQAGEIVLSAHSPAPGLLTLAVSDQGPGLPPEAAQHLFERYERGARAGQASGYGLGLWVARRIARLHGGDVQATPSAQGGTCFTLTLASGGAV